MAWLDFYKRKLIARDDAVSKIMRECDGIAG